MAKDDANGKIGPSAQDTQDAEHAQDAQDALLMELPWYLNGTADKQTVAAIERQLAVSPAFRDALEAEKALSAGIAQSPSPQFTPLSSPSDALLGPSRDRARPNPLAAFASWLQGDLKRWLIPVAVATACLVVVVVPQVDQGGFETLTTPGADTGALRVLVGDGTTPETVSALAQSHGLAILSGPSDGGVYTFTPQDGTDLEAAAQALAADPQVEFVEQTVK